MIKAYQPPYCSARDPALALRWKQQGSSNQRHFTERSVEDILLCVTVSYTFEPTICSRWSSNVIADGCCMLMWSDDRHDHVSIMMQRLCCMIQIGCLDFMYHPANAMSCNLPRPIISWCQSVNSGTHLSSITSYIYTCI